MKKRELGFYAGLIISIVAMLLVFQGSAEAAYDGMKYYPLKDGVTWNYLQTYSGGGANYEIYCLGGTETINGVACKKYWQFDSGELNDKGVTYECVAWNADYLKLYKGWRSSDSHYFICNPALKIAPRYMSIGQTHTHSTSCTEYDSDGNPLGTGPISRTIKLEGIENKQIITGTYTGCLKFSETMCEGADCEPTSTTWLAPGIGRIKSSNSEEDNELISYTNGFVTYIPGGRVIFKRTPLAGLYVLGTAPPPASNTYDNVLTPMPVLVDYNFHKATAINIGTGQYHNIGIRVSSTQYVGSLYIYVNKNITFDTNLIKSANWKIYKSSTNTVGSWILIPIESVAVSAYDPLNNIYRYEIRFSTRHKAAYYKAVNMKTVSASGITDAFVTEIEAYGADIVP